MALLFQLTALTGVAAAMVALNLALFGLPAEPIKSSDLDEAAARVGLDAASGLRFVDQGGRAAILVGNSETLALMRLGDKQVARRLPNAAVRLRLSASGAVITLAGASRACVRPSAAAPVDALARLLRGNGAGEARTDRLD